MKYQIQGEIITTTPLHIASGLGNVRFEFKTNRRVYGSKGGVPLTTVQTMSFLTDKESQSHVEVPCIHANTIRGGIRRAGATVAARILEANDERVNMDTMLRMCAGTSSGRPNQSQPTNIEELDEIYGNPFVGLFGGGERMHRSRMRTGTAIPVIDDLVELGCIPQGFTPMQDDTRKRLRSCIVIRRVDDFLNRIETLDSSIIDVVDEFNKSASERIEAAASSRAARKAGEDAAPGGNMVDSINALEFVNPGARFYVRFAVHGADHHVGMFLKALETFYQSNAIGGWTRNDFGHYQFNGLTLKTEDGQRMSIFKPGEMALSDEVSPFIDSFTAAADETIHSANLESLLK